MVTVAQASARDLMQKSAPPGVSVSVNIAEVPSLTGADRAAVVQGNGNDAGPSSTSSGCYLPKGATFVAFSDVFAGPTAPGNDALESEAQTVLARPPQAQASASMT